MNFIYKKPLKFFVLFENMNLYGGSIKTLLLTSRVLGIYLQFSTKYQGTNRRKVQEKNIISVKKQLSHLFLDLKLFH